jgi:hypothetical protein
MENSSPKKTNETGFMKSEKQAICRKMEGYRHRADF